jgi:hypothetical protein
MRVLPSDHVLPSTIYVGGYVVDYATGEIIRPDGYASLYRDRTKSQQPFDSCRSVDDYAEYISHVDRRKLPPHNLHRLRDRVDYAHGEWRRTGMDCRITVPQLRVLEKLHGLVLYRNHIVRTQAELAKALQVVPANLMIKLQPLIDRDFIRVETSRSGSMRVGEIKVLINPSLVYRSHDSEQESAQIAWYSPRKGLGQSTVQVPLAA